MCLCKKSMALVRITGIRVFSVLTANALAEGEEKGRVSEGPLSSLRSFSMLQSSVCRALLLCKVERRWRLHFAVHGVSMREEKRGRRQK